MLIFLKECTFLILIICFLQVNCKTTFEMQDYFTCQHHLTTSESEKLADEFRSILKGEYTKYKKNPLFRNCKRKPENFFSTFRSTIQFTPGTCPRDSGIQKSKRSNYFMRHIINAYKKTSKCFARIHSYMKNWLKHYIPNDMFNCITFKLKPKRTYKKYEYSVESPEIKPSDYFTCVLHLDTHASEKLDKYFTTSIKKIYKQHKEIKSCQQTISQHLWNFHETFFDIGFKYNCDRTNSTTAFFDKKSSCYDNVLFCMRDVWMRFDFPQSLTECLKNKK